MQFRVNVGREGIMGVDINQHGVKILSFYYIRLKRILMV